MVCWIVDLNPQSDRRSLERISQSLLTTVNRTPVNGLMNLQTPPVHTTPPRSDPYCRPTVCASPIRYVPPTTGHTCRPFSSLVVVEYSTRTFAAQRGDCEYSSVSSALRNRPSYS